MKVSDLINGYKFIYITDPLQRRAQPRPVGVLAYRFEEGNLTPEDIHNKGEVTVRAGVSRCNPSDQFVKRVGRLKAAGRATSDKFSHLVTVHSPEDYEPGSGDWWRELEALIRVNVLSRIPAPAANRRPAPGPGDLKIRLPIPQQANQVGGEF